MDTRFETKYGYKAGKCEWITPPEIISSLGEFDLDPCYSEPRPFKTAKNYYSEIEDGLTQNWSGFVWCNPPYGNSTQLWLKRLSEYKHCIALIFARTETKMFRKFIWEKALAIFFIYGRLTFYNSDGSKGKMSAGAPSCLVAWDEEGVKRLSALKNGKLLMIREVTDETTGLANSN